MISRRAFVLAITGASAPALGLRLAEALLASCDVHLIITKSALAIIGHELSGIEHELSVNDPLKYVLSRLSAKNLHVYENDRLDAPIASGTFQTDGMFIVPCSMKTLSAAANGYSENLVQRAADVTIKEGRRLVIAPREMPFSAIHLENMLKLARLGVVVAPPVAAFYTRPRSIDDMVDFFVGKLLDAMGVPHDLFERWGAK
jgi:4-hydroxy-3-polyprenylbenzoate decarboxylase